MLSTTYISKISRINLGCPLKFSKLDQSGNFSCFENKSGSEKLPNAKAGFVQAEQGWTPQSLYKRPQLG